jgi:hypothetical protein
MGDEAEKREEGEGGRYAERGRRRVGGWERTGKVGRRTRRKRGREADKNERRQRRARIELWNRR